MAFKLTSIYDLKNFAEIDEQFAEMLKQFDIDKNRYQTDVYLYVDESGKGTLDTFVNVGGNSWLNDDHYVLYRDKEHYESPEDDLNISDMEEITGKTRDTLVNEIDPVDPEYVTDSDIIKYVSETYKEAYETYVASFVEDSVNGFDYRDIISGIYESFDDGLKRNE